MTEAADSTASIPKKPDHPAAPRWETDTKDRLRAALRRFNKPLTNLIANDAVEGNTSQFVADFLSDALGYDKYEDLTREFQVKGEFADYGIRIDKQLVVFVEVKRATTKLNEKHLRQVQMYAINEGVEWAILTNGNDWQVYHLSAAPPKAGPGPAPMILVELTLETSLLGDKTPSQKVSDLFLLTKESLKKRQIEALWRARRATSPKSLASILVTDAVVDCVRKELRKATGHAAEASVIRELIKSTVVRADCWT